MDPFLRQTLKKSQPENEIQFSFGPSISPNLLSLAVWPRSQGYIQGNILSKVDLCHTVAFVVAPLMPLTQKLKRSFVPCFSNTWWSKLEETQVYIIFSVFISTNAFATELPSYHIKASKHTKIFLLFLTMNEQTLEISSHSWHSRLAVRLTFTRQTVFILQKIQVKFQSNKCVSRSEQNEKLPAKLLNEF